MPHTPSIEPLYAFDVYKDGRVHKLSNDELSSPRDESLSYRWVHLNLEDTGIRKWISDNVDEIASLSLTLEDTRPRAVQHQNGVLLNLRGVNLNPASDPEDMVSIRMWIEDGFIVSVRARRLMAVVGIRESIEAGNPPRNVGEFLTELSAQLISRMDPIISGLSDKVDELEEISLERTDGLRSELAHLRRTTIMLRRYIGPQREAISHLGVTNTAFFTDEGNHILREVVDRITRMVEEMDAVRERSAILYDQLSDQRAEEMNRNMLVLSVVAAIFLPLGFLTGLLGVNIAGIPGADYPLAFGLFCVALLMISLGLLWWFRKKKWI